jgi:hypothetical protein
MKQNDTTLHLWFKPYKGVMTEADVTFVERYSRRFFPKAMNPLAKALHQLAANLTRMAEKLQKADAFEYQMRHYTVNSNSRYVLEESLLDPSHPHGFNFGIQATTGEERRIFAECLTDESGNATTVLQSPLGVIAYLEDSLKMDAHKWENAKLHNGIDAISVVQEVITFLKAVKNSVRVYNFEVIESEDGPYVTMALLTPGVLAYYTRLDWTIV